MSKENADQEEEKSEDEVERYDQMSDEEFLETIRSRTAKKLGVSKEEMDKMKISEIEKELNIETRVPQDHNDHRGGYFVGSGRFDVLSRDEIEKREKKVRKFLEKF